jgi:serine/threonine protein kinase
VKTVEQMMQDQRNGDFFLRVYDLRREGRFQFYIAQELGVCDLAKLVSEFTFDFNQKREFVIQLATAIEFLHDSLGLVHRDLRPENIIVTVNMTCKLADFGFTRTALDNNRARTLHSTNTGMVMQPFEVCSDSLFYFLVRCLFVDLRLIGTWWSEDRMANQEVN